MVKVFKSICSGWFAIVLLGQLFATTNAFAAYQATATTTLNFRAGPGTNYQVIGSIPNGGLVTVYNCTENYGWCDIGFSGQRGWASGRYLSYAGSGTYYGQPLVSAGVYIGLPLIWHNYPIYRPRPPYRPPGYRPPGHRPPRPEHPIVRPPRPTPPIARPPGNRPPGVRPPGNRPPGVRPPGNRPPGARPPRPSQPIARPPGGRPGGARPPSYRPRPGARPRGGGGRRR